MAWPFNIIEKRVTKVLEERAITSIDGYWPDAGSGGQAVASTSRALSVVPVFGAVRTISDLVASLPPVLYKVNQNGGIPERQPTPSLFANPSIHGTLYDWFFRGTLSMALQGDAIGLKTATDYYGFPTMVEWLNPEQVSTQDGKLYGPGSYSNPMWWWWGRPIDPKMLVHIPWFTIPYRVRGLSPIGAYQMTTNIGVGAKEFQMNWFGQGGVPPGKFQNSERIIDPKDADQITDKITNRLRSRKPLVFGRDWDYTPIAIKPHEAEFIATCQLTATEIAVIYGFSPEDLGGTTGNSLTYNTVEMNNIKLLTRTLRPWLRRWEYALTRCFPKGYYVKFDPTDMLMLDAKTQADIDNLSLGFQNAGWSTQDEVRAARDKPPLPKPKVVPVQQSGGGSDDDAPGDDSEDQPPVSNNNGSSNGHGKISGTNLNLSGSNSAATKGN